MTRNSNARASSRTEGAGHGRTESGYALVETLLMLPVLFVLVAAVLQIHRVHQAEFNTLTRVHQELLTRAFARNCATSSSACQFSTDPVGDGLPGSTTVLWPARVPVLGAFFTSADVGGKLSVAFNNDRADLCSTGPCRRTYVGTGTYLAWYRGLLFALAARPGDADQIAGLAAGNAAGVFDGPVDFDGVGRSVGALDGALSWLGF